MIILAFIIGYVVGHMSAINVCFEVGKKFAEVQFGEEVVAKAAELYGWRYS